MDNLAVIERLYEAVRLRDYQAFEAICDDSLVWVQNPGFPGGGTHHGAPAVVAGVFEAFSNEWEGFRFVIAERFEAGPRVVVLGRYEGTHRGTGESFEAAAAHVYDLAGGKVQRFRQFADTHVIQAARW